MILSIRIALFTLLISLSANAVLAAPYIDDSLKRYITSGGSDDTSPLTVIATYRNLETLPVVAHRLSNRVTFQMAMKRNAAKSQAAALRILGDLATQTSGVISVRSIWLTNALIIRMPSHLLGQLVKDNNLVGLFANQRVQLEPVHKRAPRIRGEEYTYGLKKILIPELRAKLPSANGEGVKVGILDTGIDADHRDLKGRLILWKDFADKDTEPNDNHGHGTHVAGTISGGNSSGTWIGIAPNVKLIIGKVFDANGSASWDTILEAMQWIADPDGNPATNDAPRLVSNSWGGRSPSKSKDPADEPLCRAVSGWAKLGMLPVFAAGNSGPKPQTVGLPAACPDALAVAATDSSDAIADFSSRGPAIWKTGEFLKPVVAAPGVDILSSLPGGMYEEWSGTSMATPHVAGVSALVYQLMPNATVEEVAKLLISGVDDQGTKGSDPDFGWGRINALNSVKGTMNYMRTGLARP